MTSCIRHSLTGQSWPSLRFVSPHIVNQSLGFSLSHSCQWFREAHSIPSSCLSLRLYAVHAKVTEYPTNVQHSALLHSLLQVCCTHQVVHFTVFCMSGKYGCYAWSHQHTMHCIAAVITIVITTAACYACQHQTHMHNSHIICTHLLLSKLMSRAWGTGAAKTAVETRANPAEQGCPAWSWLLLGSNNKYLSWEV